MPADFKKTGRSNNGGGKKKELSIPDTRISDPRCLVCSHKSRKVIDKFLVRSTPYAELSRVFGINWQSISNHDKKHLNIGDAAARAIVKQEAEAAGLEEFEEGVRGVVKRKVYLETALDKALESILNGDVMVEPRDAVAIIDKLDSLETETHDAIVSQMKIELAAYLQAMREIVPEAQWERIIARTRELSSRTTPAQLSEKTD